MVIKATWFGLISKKELSRLVRIQVDIPNSSVIDKEWRLDVKKSNAAIPPSLKKYLQKAVSNLSKTSVRRFTKRAKQKFIQQDFWISNETEQGDITYEINIKNPFVSYLIDKNPEVKYLLKAISETIPYDSIYTDRANGKNIIATSIDKEELEHSISDLPDDIAIRLREIFNV